MRIISFIEPSQPDVIEKILRHCGLGDQPSSRAPPAADESPVHELRALTYVSDWEYVDVPPPEPVWSD
jgi:hypothetical protein